MYRFVYGICLRYLELTLIYSSIFYYTYLLNIISFLHGIEFLTYNIPIYILLVGGYLAISFDIKKLASGSLSSRNS